MMIYDLKNGEKLSIRKIEESDVKTLVALGNKIGGETDNLTFGVDEYYFSEEQLKTLIVNIKGKNNCLYIAAIINNRIIGSLSFISHQRKRMMHRGELGIGVLKEYWYLGVGSALMDSLLRWVKANGVIKKMELQVREDNVRAINLYHKYGFEIEGKISRGMVIDKNYYDIYIMGKKIEE